MNNENIISSNRPPIFACPLLTDGLAYDGLTATVTIQRTSDNKYWDNGGNLWDVGATANPCTETKPGLYEMVSDTDFFVGDSFFTGKIYVTWNILDGAVVVHDGSDVFIIVNEAQNTRDAMKLDPSAGAADADSIDQKLDDTKSTVDTISSDQGTDKAEILQAIDDSEAAIVVKLQESHLLL